MYKFRRRLKGTGFWVACVAVLMGVMLSGCLAQFSQLSQSAVSNSALRDSSSLVHSQIVTLSAVVNSTEPITPVIVDESLNARKVALGSALFHEPRLSRNNRVSCASCHDHELGGADGQAHSVGIDGQLAVFNAPTVWNSSLNFRQFWDGRSASLEDQINGPVLDPKEMDSSWPEVVSKLRQDSEYVSAFRQLYPEGIEPNAVREAITTYEKSLVTPNARFDQYLKGDESAITADEKAGYQRFKDYGCVACHQGVNIGGNMFQRLGVIEDFFVARGTIHPSDLGRMNISERSRDRYVFKVPGLRNVALTAPYLHDGSVETLEEAVSIMTRYQLGRDIPADDINLIVKFLNTLTGELPAKQLEEAV